jgi:hypothetical protein
MENNEAFPPNMHRPANTPNHQLVIITQLLQIASNIRHIDELLLWLAHSMGQRLDLEAIQFWANQNYIGGQSSPTLRAIACRQNELPLHVLTNAHIVEVAGNLLAERRGRILAQPVGNVFPITQAEMLTHSHLHYWMAAFVSHNTLLPPMSNDTSSGAVATPLAMVISLFTQQPPAMNTLGSVSRIVEHALSVAKNRGFLVQAGAKPFPSSPHLATQQAQAKPLPLKELIPHRTQDVTALQSGNPFAHAVEIADKRARKVYSAIDGKRSLAEILGVARLEQEELTAALHFLLQQQLISFHEPNGKPIESSLFLKAL